MYQENHQRLRTAIQFSLSSLQELLKLTPKELLALFPSVQQQDFPSDHNTENIIYIIENLQESLNLVLDARKRLILLGIYDLGANSEETRERQAREQEIQERARIQVPAPLEEDGCEEHHHTEQPHHCSVPVPPNTDVEI